MLYFKHVSLNFYLMFTNNKSILRFNIIFSWYKAHQLNIIRRLMFRYTKHNVYDCHLIKAEKNYPTDEKWATEYLIIGSAIMIYSI